MPLQQCTTAGRAGWRWGQRGKCYPGPTGKQRAIKQALAMGERPTHNARANPLQMDPTRTATLRRQFQAELRRRINQFKRAVHQLLVTDDVLGLKPPPDMLRLARNVSWQFRTSEEQLRLFHQWLQANLGQGVLGGVTDATAADAWWRAYIEQGYRKGAGRSFDDVRQKGLEWTPEEGAFYRGTREEFLRSAFARPVSLQKVKLLVSRVFTELRDVTDTMAAQLTRTLADGLVEGRGPRDVARRIYKQVDGLTRRRAEVIARTELIRSHAEGQLDALEQLGVEELGVMVEWSTTGDARVCPLCQSLQGVVIKIDKAHGMLPRHPNCRCAWLPANVGEPHAGQKRGATAQQALKESVRRQAGTKQTTKQVVKEAEWAGAGAIGAKQVTKPLKEQLKPAKPKTYTSKQIFDEVDRLVKEQKEQFLKTGKGMSDRGVVQHVLTNRANLARPVLTHGMSTKSMMDGLTIDGIEWMWEAGQLSNAAETLLYLRRKPLPKKLLKQNRTIYFTGQQNRHDPYWRKRYNDPTLVSAATGGDTNVMIYNTSVGPGTIAHESGHNLAFNQWKATAPPADSAYGKAQQIEKPVSSYGANSPAEDFAEATAMYVDARHGGVKELKERYPNKYQALKELLE